MSHFYKEIHEVFPEAKVLMNVRDPEKWYESVRDSILEVVTTLNSWPCTWMNAVLGVSHVPEILRDLSDPVPTSSSDGKRKDETYIHMMHSEVSDFQNL